MFDSWFSDILKYVADSFKHFLFFFNIFLFNFSFVDILKSLFNGFDLLDRQLNFISIFEDKFKFLGVVVYHGKSFFMTF